MSFPRNTPRLNAAVIDRRIKWKDGTRAIAELLPVEVPVGAQITWTIGFRRPRVEKTGKVVGHRADRIIARPFESSGGLDRPVYIKPEDLTAVHVHTITTSEGESP